MAVEIGWRGDDGIHHTRSQQDAGRTRADRYQACRGHVSCNASLSSLPICRNALTHCYPIDRTNLWQLREQPRHALQTAHGESRSASCSWPEDCFSGCSPAQLVNALVPHGDFALMADHPTGRAAAEARPLHTGRTSGCEARRDVLLWRQLADRGKERLSVCRPGAGVARLHRRHSRIIACIPRSAIRGFYMMARPRCPMDAGTHR